MSESASRNNNGSNSTNIPENPTSKQGDPQPSKPPQSTLKTPAKMPSMAPVPVPPGQAASAYKPVNPKTDTEQQNKKPAKKSGNKLLIVGIVVCVLAVAALVCALLFVTNKPAESSAQQTTVNAPSNSQITKALEDANLKVPDISSYKYVITTDLTGPTFTEIETTQGNSSNVCNVTAVAVFKNSSIMVEQPAALRFTQKDNEWTPGTVTTSPADVTPVSAPDIQALTKDLPNLLTEYDENVANQFTNCDIVADDKDLSAQGGTARFTLAKTEGDTVKKCDVEMKLEWKKDSGWNPQIESVSNIATTSSEQNNPEDPIDPDSEQPDALLQCSSGDLVQIPGIINYTSDRVLLKADNFIRVEIDGKVFNVHYFELQSDTMQFTVGSHIEVTGTISETGTLRQAPLVINLDF